MAHVSVRRAVTYIALGATTTLGTMSSTRAFAADGMPQGAPRALSASPGTLTLPERLSLIPTQPMAVLALRQPGTLAPVDAPVAAAATETSKSETAPAPEAAPQPSLGTVATAPATAAEQLSAEAAPADATQGAVAALPVPDALVPQVEFWKRVYTEVDSDHGFVHDAWHLSVVYDTIRVPSGNRRQSMRAIAKQVSRVAGILRNLAHGHREHPTADEARVLAAWPADVSDATLLEAARNVRFQTGQSDKFRAGLVRARTWTPFIETTLTAAGLPRELAALPHVESSFNMTAYSKVRAAGIWQFMPSTARLFMHMDSTVDERLDPVRSTESAAQLLAQNYRLLGSWPLAITAYNHGPQGVRRAMTKTGSLDLAVIIAKFKTRHFGFASRNFYTELLAAWDVSQHPEKYFGATPTEEAVQYESVTTDAFYHAKSVASALGLDVATLREHNPALRPVVWSNSRLIPRGYTLRVPRGLVRGDMLAMLSAIPQTERFAHAYEPARTAAGRRHPIAVAMATPRRHGNARRFVAQRGKVTSAAQPPASGPLPWEKQVPAQIIAPGAQAATTRLWFQ